MAGWSNGLGTGDSYTFTVVFNGQCSQIQRESAVVKQMQPWERFFAQPVVGGREQSVRVLRLVNNVYHPKSDFYF